MAPCASLSASTCLGRLVSSSTLGCGEVRRRDVQRREILLVDGRERLDQLAMGAHLDHHHGSKFAHHHERRRLLGGLLVPPWQRVARGLDMDPQRTLEQPSQ